jgi:hypothetical protein
VHWSAVDEEPAVVMWVFGLAMIAVVAGALLWSLRRFRIVTRDAVDLAAKLAVPRPVSVADWPELRVEEVVCDPQKFDCALIVARWPGNPEPAALVLLRLDDAPERAKSTLARWKADAASISPMPRPGGGLLMRRRRSKECINASVVRQTIHV